MNESFFVPDNPNVSEVKVISLFLIILLLSSTLINSQDDVIYMTRNGQVKFTSSVPLHEFTGESAYLTGMIDFDENLIDFYLDLSTLKTGNERRDRDMYRTLNVNAYPFAEFTGTFDSSFDLNSSDIQNVTVRGEFTLHGITREKVVEGTLQRQGNQILLEASWIQDITDHDIEPPGILFYRVRDEMDVHIRATLLSMDKSEAQIR